MRRIHAWLLAPNKKEESHKYFYCRTKIGFYLRLFWCKIFYDYIETNDVNKALDVAKNALEEIQKYKAIGTIKECQEVMERQREKKRILESYCGFDSFECPTCGANVNHSAYCHRCGQKLEAMK